MIIRLVISDDNYYQFEISYDKPIPVGLLQIGNGIGDLYFFTLSNTIVLEQKRIYLYRPITKLDICLDRTKLLDDEQKLGVFDAKNIVHNIAIG